MYDANLNFSDIVHQQVRYFSEKSSKYSGTTRNGTILNKNIGLFNIDTRNNYYIILEMGIFNRSTQEAY